VDLRLVDVAAFRAPQGPVLKAGTVLDRHAGLASGTPRALGGARRQFGRRVQIGHGIDPKQVTNGDYLKPGSGAVVPAVLKPSSFDISVDAGDCMAHVARRLHADARDTRRLCT
jgi:hypothetical protein